MAIGVNWAEIWAPVWKTVWQQAGSPPPPSPSPSPSTQVPAGSNRNKRRRLAEKRYAEALRRRLEEVKLERKPKIQPAPPPRKRVVLKVGEVQRDEDEDILFL